MSEKRRIKQITVTGLFGVFDHVIPLNMDERITIIHGPNGYGKTIIMTMLNDLFNSSYQKFTTIPFQKFHVELEDGSVVWLKQAESNKAKRKTAIVHFCIPGMDTEQSFHIPEWERKDIIEFAEDIPELRRMTPSLWRDLSSGETLSIDEIAARYGGFFPGDSGAEREFPEWDSLRKSVSIRFIQTQRLLVPSRERLRYEYPRDDVTKPTVMEYARQLAIRIERELAKYAYQSQDLDRSFPRRLIEQQQGSSGLKDYQLREKLGKLEEKRQQFIDAGLLDKTEEMSAIPEEIRDGTIKDDTRGVLSIYVDDVAQKLGVLDPIASKIDLLRRIINRLFHEKQMKVSKDKGFTFTTSQGNRLSPQDLSSGEQHELVMLYEFLFKVQPNTLVMIDEPEISLHVVWQGKFLSDLQEIIKLSNFDVLMATHSPDIISDKWELTVGLGKTTA